MLLFNGRSAVHEKSGGEVKTISINYTGHKRVPIAYQNTALSIEAKNVAQRVLCNGVGICTINSFFAQSFGDEAGAHGGIFSGSVNGRAEFVTGSQNILINGVPVVRAFDLMVSNNRNTQPQPLQQPRQDSHHPEIPWSQLIFIPVQTDFVVPLTLQRPSGIYQSQLMLTDDDRLEPRGQHQFLFTNLYERNYSLSIKVTTESEPLIIETDFVVQPVNSLKTALNFQRLQWIYCDFLQQKFLDGYCYLFCNSQSWRWFQVLEQGFYREQSVGLLETGVLLPKIFDEQPVLLEYALSDTQQSASDILQLPRHKIDLFN